jgi:Kef-type K+ transport system membrane component KefB
MATELSTIVMQLGVTVVAAAGCGLLVRALRLPPLLGYVLAGIGLGGLAGTFIADTSAVAGASQLGLALLLFLVGLEMNWAQTKEQFRVASVVGIIQLIASLVIGTAISMFSGLSLLAGLILGLALSFSSTVVVVKLLSEARDVNTLHGRLSVSTLLIQDFVAIVVLVILTGTAEASNLPVSMEMALLLMKATGLILLAYASSKLVLPWLFAKVARDPELLFLSSLGWCLLWALGVYYLHLPLEVGALIAGLTLAPLPYSIDIVNKIRVLRDFFVVLLFVNMGIIASVPLDPRWIGFSIALTVFVILIRPIVTYVTFSIAGYRSKTALFTALTQGQLSEFSLIVAATAVGAGILPAFVETSITSVALLSMVGSTILFAVRKQLFSLLKPVLRFTERGHRRHSELILGDSGETEALQDHIILIGYHRMGYHILKQIRKQKREVVVIDFNPDIVEKLRQAGVTALYGDVEDEEIHRAAHTDTASLIISTVPHREETEYLIQTCKQLNKRVHLVVVAHRIDDALHYYRLGASYVLLPHMLGGEHVAELIGQRGEDDLAAFMQTRAEELKHLRSQQSALYYD